MRGMTGVIAVLLVGISACSSGGGGRGKGDATSSGSTSGGDTGGTPGGRSGGGSGTSGSLQQVRDQWVQATCDGVDNCFGQAAASFGVTDCEEAIGPILDEVTFPLFQQGLDKGTVVLNTSALSACVSATSDSCDFLSALPAECSSVLAGQIAVGDPCVNSLECATGSWCDMEAACPGKCTAKAEAGARCEDDEGCAAGLACVEDVCEALIASGAECTTKNDHCAPGTTCVPSGSAGGSTSRCTPFDDLFQAPLGSACNPLEGRLCKPGSVCAVQSDMQWKCENRVSAGASCKIAVPDQCPTGQACGQAGKCANLPAAGAACLKGDGVLVQCATGLKCIKDTCQQQVSIGAPCQDDDFCFTGRCAEGVCAAPPFDSCVDG